MNETTNIPAILRGKPQGTKLHDLARGINVYLDNIADDCNEVHCFEKKGLQMHYYSSKGTLVGFEDGMVILVPSETMRDWSKFAWKKGDVLSCGVDNLCIFEKWANEEYTELYAKFVTPNYSGNTFKTEKWSKETNEAVIKQYISNIEEFKGGKLNLTTLEIEKQPEFKDGDIVVYGKSVAICRKIYKHTLYFYVSIDETFGLLFDDNCVSAEGYRFATEEEKLQLFNAILAKKGKAWDVEKKMIIDLKQKVELKPFDKVLVRDDKEDQWSANIFSYQVRDMFHCLGEGYWRYCIPYEGNEHLLGTTKEVED